MKGKFSLIWRVVIAMVMVLSLSLVMAAPVGANVSPPEVTLNDYSPTTAAIYTIEFTTTEGLAIGDGIVIEFPTGTAGLDDIDTNNTVTVSPGTFTEAVTNEGDRLSITLDAVLEAGDITVVVGDESHKVINPADGDYTLDVYTSEEPTAVTSAEYMISKALAVGNPTPTPDTVDTAANYAIPFTTSADMVRNDYIVIEFPVDTDISAVETADVTIAGVSSPAVKSATPVGQVLTVTLDGTLDLGETTVTIANTSIINPTTVANNWILTVYDSYRDRIPAESGAYSTTAAAATTISKLVITVVDSYISNDTVSDLMTVEAQDQYGNATVVGGSGTTVLLSADPSGGSFYDNNGTPLSEDKVTIAHDSSSATFKFSSATAGTYTITASEDPAATPDWTDGTADVLVNPKLELWGGGSCRDEYNTFAAAITDALPYDTIKVAPSTYDGGITVSKPYLTIESTGTAAETIIDGLDTNAGILISAAGVTVDGFTVKDAASYAIQVTGANATVVNNVMTAAEGYPWGIQIDTAGAAGAEVSGNELDIFSTVLVRNVSGVTLSDNIFGAGINLENANNIEITGNDLTGSEYVGIRFQGGSGFENILIEDNTISGITASENPLDAGIGFFGSYTVTGLQIIYNDITDNEGPGIVIPATVTLTTPKIMYNDISGNGGYGIDAAVDVAYNWWGSPAGPGDAVSAAITTYSPWLAVSQSVCVPAASPRYVTEVELANTASHSGGTWSGGWNTFSTPIWLHQDGDTWGEIKTLASITADDVGSVYGWDGTTWTTPTEDTVLYPLDAIFVQLKTAQHLPILWGTQLLPAPTKSMHAAAGSYIGWELVGVAYDPTASTQASADAILSITGNCSQTIDPIGGAVDPTNLNVGAGYWVFMTSDATLAGYTITPQTFVSVTPS